MKYLAFVLAGSMVTSTALAQDGLVEAPHFLVRSPSAVDHLPLQETDTKIAIAGVIAHVRVEQVYKNDGSEPIEATYVFSGSTNAAVFGMTMTIGTRTIVADIAERDAARRLYETAKNEGRSASLLEQHRPNVFSMNVANIMPGDRIVVRLDYTELLVPEEGVYELVVPGVVNPRFDGESNRHETWNENPHLASAPRSPMRWSMSASIVGGMPVRAVQSPSHTIAPHFTAQGTAKIQVIDHDKRDDDFILRYRLDGERIDAGILLYEGKDENFFAAIVQPPNRVAPSSMPPREYLFVVDVSGSMSGFPIETAQALMKNLLKGLQGQDRFNVLLFAGDQTVFSERSVPATDDNIARALGIITQMRGGGGTNLLDALDRAAEMPRGPDMSSTTVVITDGFVTVEAEAFRRIRERLDHTNVFTFGIGRSVNRHLIEGLARAGMGRPFVVTDAEAAPAVAETFAKYIASPVLTNIEVVVDGLDAYDVSPQHVPDLFGERPIVVFGKYHGPAHGTLHVTGTSGASTFTHDVAIGESVASDDLVALKYLWARDRIASLEDDPEAKAEVTALGIRYHLMTAYTSFVAVDDGKRNNIGPPTEVRQAQAAQSGVLGYRGSNTSITYPMTLQARGSGGGGGGHLALNSIAPMSGSPVVMGSLDKNIILKVIKSANPQFGRVFETALKSNPNVKGKIVLKFLIDSDGRVSRVSVTSSTIDDKRLERDVIAIVKRLRFPKPMGGGAVFVTYPFLFRSK